MTAYLEPSLVHVIPSDGIGGVEVAARSMAGRDDLACRFTLILVAGNSLTSGQPSIRASPFRSSLNPLAQCRALYLIWSMRPDIVVFSLWRTAFIAVALRLLRPRSTIVYFLHLDRATHPLDRIGSALGIAVASQIWGDSQTTLERRLAGSNKPRRVISFVTERLLPPPPELPQPHFILWARINEQKGIDRAIAIIDALRHNGINARYDVWGPDGGALDALKAKVEHLELQHSVLFLGPLARDALASVASQASFFLQPSRAEGMAMSCVEAMQMGLVPLVTAVGEMAEYVKDGQTGLIVDGARPDHDARRIEAVLADPAQFASIRRAALRRWTDAPLYADDLCQAASDLAKRR